MSKSINVDLKKQFQNMDEINDIKKEIRSIKNFQDKLTNKLDNPLTNLRKLNSTPEYAEDFTKMANNISNGNPVKMMFITIMFLTGIIFVLADLLTYSNKIYNVMSFLILNTIFLPTIPHILVSIFQTMDKSSGFFTSLPGPVYFFSAFFISLLINYKLYKLYITQKCAEKNIQCDYAKEIIIKPLEYAFITTIINTSLTVLFRFVFLGLTFIPATRTIGKVLLKLYEMNNVFKYGVIFNIIGFITHTMSLYLIDTKLKVPKITY
jgi:hypothetical protein